MEYQDNSIIKPKAIVFDQLSFWLIVGVLVIFLAGTLFGRLTDSKSGNASSSTSVVQMHHAAVYGRFGSLHWAR
jgi:hypothetical protein